MRFPTAGAGGNDPQRGPLGGYRKRVLDVVIAGSVLLLLLPIALVAILLIRLLIGRGVFWVEELIGLEGKTFASYKFRTSLVHEHWSARTSAHALNAAREHNFWAQLLAETLRVSGLDKVPLLFNVLIGDMSLVGPRPMASGQLNCRHAYRPEVLIARPGLTGMWRHAVARDLRAPSRRSALDRYYVRHWSMRLDCALLLKAVCAGFHRSETV